MVALRDQPELRVEIAGHTDFIGKAELNQQLSEERAQRVVDYLVAHGIASERLTAVGYGSTRPIADNKNHTHRPQNRRVEVTVK